MFRISLACFCLSNASSRSTEAALCLAAIGRATKCNMATPNCTSNIVKIRQTWCSCLTVASPAGATNFLSQWMHALILWPSLSKIVVTLLSWGESLAGLWVESALCHLFRFHLQRKAHPTKQVVLILQWSRLTCLDSWWSCWERTFFFRSSITASWSRRAPVSRPRQWGNGWDICFKAAVQGTSPVCKAQITTVCKVKQVKQLRHWLKWSASVYFDRTLASNHWSSKHLSSLGPKSFETGMKIR